MRLNRKHQFSLPLQQQNQFNGTVKESMEARLCLQEDGEGQIVTSEKEKKRKNETLLQLSLARSASSRAQMWG